MEGCGMGRREMNLALRHHVQRPGLADRHVAMEACGMGRREMNLALRCGGTFGRIDSIDTDQSEN
jgi:hypothetical protein